MGKVRQAGFLYRKEGNSELKHWCVVRDQSFIVYPSQQSLDQLRSDTDRSPIYILPLTEIFLKSFTNHGDRKESEFGLQVQSATSGVSLLFYVEHVMALEKWLKALEPESAADDVASKNLPQNSPFPPKLDTTPVSLSPEANLITPFSSRFGKNTLSMRYLEQVEGISLNNDGNTFSFEYNENFHPKQPQRSISMTSFQCNGDEMKSVTTPTRSSRVTAPDGVRQLNSQDSADKIYVKSTTTKSIGRALTHAKTRGTFNRQLALTTDKHSSHDMDSEEKIDSASVDKQKPIKKPTLDFNFIGTGSKTTVPRSPDIKKNKEKSGKFFPTKFHTVGRNTSKKRWTISDLSQQDSAELKEYHLNQAKSKATNQNKTSKQIFKTISPLSNLDLSLKERKKKNRPNLTILSEQIQPLEQNHSESSSSSSSDEDSTMQSSYLSRIEFSKHQFSPNLHTPDQNLETKFFPLRKSELNMSMPNLATTDSRSTPNLLKNEKSSKHGSNIGALVRKRITSPATTRKRSDGERVNVISPLATKTSHHKKTQLFKEKNENNKPKSEIEDLIIMKEGWLYKKKMVTWHKLWACLCADKMLRFYKSQQKLSKSELNIDLSRGCDVGDIAQEKNINTFWLFPAKRTTDDLSKPPPDDVSRKLWKPLNLMCKNTEEFVHWIKQFVLLNPQHSLKKDFDNDTKEKESEMKENPLFMQKELNNNWKTRSRADSVGSSSSSAPHSVDSLSFDASLARHDDNSSVSSATKIRPNRYSSEDCLRESGLSSTNGSVSYESRENLSLDPAYDYSGGRAKNPEEKEIKLEQALTTGGKGSRYENNNMRKVTLTKDKTNKNYDKMQFQTFLKKIENPAHSFEDEVEETGNILIGAEAKSQLARIEKSKNKNQSHNSHFLMAQNREQILSNRLITKESQLTTGVKNSNSKRKDSNRFKLKTHSTTNKQRDRSSSSETSSASDSDDVRDGARQNSRLPFSHQASAVSDQSMRPAESGLQAGRKHDFSRSKSEEKLSEDLRINGERKELYKTLSSLRQKDSDALFAIKNTNNQIENSSLIYSGTVDDSTSLSSIKLGQSATSSVDKLKTTASASDLPLLRFNREENLKRSTSDSNLLEPSRGKSYRMKKNNKAIPELTRIDFIEIYGLPKHEALQQCILGMTEIPKTNVNRRNSVESDDSSIHVKLSEESSSGNTSSDDKITSDKKSTVNRANSGSETSEDLKSKRHSWFFNVTPKLRKSVKRSSEEFKRTNKEQIFQIPASQLKAATHRGFLEMRDKKKRWEQFWCVFEDACLYLYNTPQSDVTRNAFVIRGYDVLANVKKTNCEKFEFRLQREGAPTLHFCTENYQDFLMWVATLEREIHSNDQNSNRESIDSRTQEVFTDVPPEELTSETSSNPSPMLLKRSFSQEELEKEIVEMQKHKLLKEIATEREKLLIEQRALHRLCSEEDTKTELVESTTTKKKREDVVRKFEQMRDQEVAKATKSMAFLNRRRNSAQLKLDQITKDLAPKSNRKRRDDHQRYAALEAKQYEMKQRLQEVDREISQFQTSKHNIFEKIQERQELELMLAEQQDVLDILFKQKKNGDPPVIRKRHQSKESRNTLLSIEEKSVEESDGRISISSRSSDSSENKLMRSKLTCFDEKRSGTPPPVFENLNKDPHPLSILRTLSTDSHNWNDNISRSCSSDNLSKTSTPLSLSSSNFSVNSAKHSTPNPSHNNQSEINSSVLASIEDFEKFSAKMLEKNKNKARR